MMAIQKRTSEIYSEGANRKPMFNRSATKGTPPSFVSGLFGRRPEAGLILKGWLIVKVEFFEAPLNFYLRLTP